MKKTGRADAQELSWEEIGFILRRIGDRAAAIEGRHAQHHRANTPWDRAGLGSLF